ncbi:MAG: imidazolonepropionase [Bacteroidia bacterium]|nr:imidazolonepropionase [Bacteroidia bacterium]
MEILIGPFAELLSFEGLGLKGAISDEELLIQKEAGVWVKDGRVLKTGPFHDLRIEANTQNVRISHLDSPMVALPGFVDAHTHICFGGSRARDYAMRNAGKSYLEIARSGGGIWDSVQQTRNASKADLISGIKNRAARHLKDGITTIEVKSGYGLNLEQELKMLEAIREANLETEAELIPTCLAAHICPKDFDGEKEAYLAYILSDILPELKNRKLTNRVDIFIEDTAFEVGMSKDFLLNAKAQGFDLTVHADQFHSGGSKIAVEVEARSADHLEASGEKEVEILAKSNTVAVVLPGASMGLGEPFGPARKLLDGGASLAIASDWNPGSAPMGNLLTQAAVLGTYEKLSTAETLSALTFRAAAALGLEDRGRLLGGMRADIVAFPVSDHREILYHQGSLKPNMVWKAGKLC